MSVMKYRRKQTEVEAVQYKGTGESFVELNSFVGSNLYVNSDGKVIIKTTRGIKCVYLNDYVVKDIDGEFRVYRPDILEELYERMENK